MAEQIYDVLRSHLNKTVSKVKEDDGTEYIIESCKGERYILLTVSTKINCSVDNDSIQKLNNDINIPYKYRVENNLLSISDTRPVTSNKKADFIEKTGELLAVIKSVKTLLECNNG